MDQYAELFTFIPGKTETKQFFLKIKMVTDPLLISLVRHLIDKGCTSMIHLEFS